MFTISVNICDAIELCPGHGPTLDEFDDANNTVLAHIGAIEGIGKHLRVGDVLQLFLVVMRAMLLWTVLQMI